MPKFNKNQYTLKQVYKFYKDNVEDPVSYKEHKLILETWGDTVVEYLLLGKDVKLHCGLATLHIKKRIKRTYIDYKETKEKGELIKRSNVHSGFYRASVYWKRHYTNFNSSGWVFRPSRNLSRKLSKVMKMYLGHTRFVKRAIMTSKPAQTRSTYVNKVLKL